MNLRNLEDREQFRQEQDALLTKYGAWRVVATLKGLHQVVWEDANSLSVADIREPKLTTNVD